MAIASNVIYWIDQDNGVDTVRSSFAGVASNPSGTITRITRVAHGLQSGAVVDLTLFASWLNGVFRITRVDADNFDLDDTPWVNNSDVNGTVTPRGGNINDPWKSLTNGATAPRLAGLTSVNFEVRHKKTPDPVSLGVNATLTTGSTTGTLASALTYTIDNCESGWVAGTNGTVAYSTTGKQGAQGLSVGFVGTGEIAYKDLGSNIDLSSYTGLTFWTYTSSVGSFATGTIQIRLYSDTGRTNLVNTINLQACNNSTKWMPHAILTGGPLSNSVRVIQIYNVSTPAKTITFDNISACNSSLHLRSLIGVNDGLWMPMDWIDGTSFGLCYNVAAVTTNPHYGWPKDTTTTPLYSRDTYWQVDGGTATTNTIMNSLFVGGGGQNQRARYSFGWNLTNQTQDGETWIDGLYSLGNAFSIAASQRYIDISRACCTRNQLLVAIASNQWDITLTGCKISGVSSANHGLLSISTVDYKTKFDSCITYGGQYVQSVASTSQMEFVNCEFYNSTAVGGLNIINSERVKITNCIFAGCIPTAQGFISNSGSTDVVVDGCTFKNHLGPAIQNYYSGSLMTMNGCSFINCATKISNLQSCKTFVANCSFDNLTNLFAPSTVGEGDSGYAYFHNLNNVANDHRRYSLRGNIFTDNVTYHDSATYSWKFMPLVDYPMSSNIFPIEMELHKCVCTANVAQTISVWVMRDNVGLSVGLRIKDNVLPGVVLTDVLCTAAINTWQQISLTFTPTQSGVVQIYGIAYGGTTYNGWISDFTPMSNISTKKLDIAYLGQPFSSNAGDSGGGSGSTPVRAYIG